MWIPGVFFPILNNSVLNKSVHKPLLLFCIISLDTIHRNEITDVESINSFNVPTYCQKNSEGTWRRLLLSPHASLMPFFLASF